MHSQPPMGWLVLALVVIVVVLVWARSGHGKQPSSRASLGRLPDKPIMQLGPGPNDWLHIDQCYANIFASGMAGSAKTTGFAAHLGIGLLSHPSRPGFVVLCCKPDEAERWFRYAKMAGRERDIIHVRIGGDHVIDILDYELSSKGGSVESAGQLLDCIMEVANRNKSRNSSDSFWPESSGRQMRYAMTLIRMAHGSCSLSDVLEFCQSLPNTPEQVKEPEWIKESFAAKCLIEASKKHAGQRPFEMAGTWLCSEWAELSDKTKSVIQSVTLNTLDKFLSGPFADLISSGESTFTPEMALEDGKIIILDIPTAVYKFPAQWTQIAVKLLFMNAAMRRDLSQECRPFVLWADEAANFVVPNVDAMFLSQSRQFRTVCVHIIQNLPLAYTALGGGDTAKQNAMAWISNHATYLCAANSDAETNGYFSGVLGEFKEVLYGGSGGFDGNYDMVGDVLGTWRGSGHASWNEQYRPQFPAHHFATLRKGGKDNDCVMEAVVFQSGRRWSNGKTWIKTKFRQIF